MSSGLWKTVVRKFVDVVDLKNWQVESDQGFVDVKTINKTVKYDDYDVATESGRRLRCADDHVLITDDGGEIFAKDSIGRTVKTKDGAEKIVYVGRRRTRSSMYDLQLADDTSHLYYTNGFLSHNTTTYTIYALWLCMFHCEKKIMLLANKADTALEIMSRIRMAYEYLPDFLKSAVLVWNKGEVVFANRSAIKGFATASDAARGYSANCVNKDSIIYIRSKYIKWLKIPVKIKRLKTIADAQEILMHPIRSAAKCLRRFAK